MLSSFSVKTLWIGGVLKPLHLECLSSFLRHGASVELYGYDTIPNLSPGILLKDAQEILPRSEIFSYQIGPGKGSYSAFSNIFRYALLLKKGGVWIDTDMFCLRPWKFTEPYSFASETTRTETQRIVASCMIHCPKNSKLMEFCLDESYRLKSKDLQWGEIGPQLLSRAVKQLNLESYIHPSWEFCSVGWDEAELLYRPDSAWSPPQRAFAVHLNHEMLRRSQQDFNSEVVNRLNRWTLKK